MQNSPSQHQFAPANLDRRQAFGLSLPPLSLLGLRNKGKRNRQNKVQLQRYPLDKLWTIGHLIGDRSARWGNNLCYVNGRFILCCGQYFSCLSVSLQHESTPFIVVTLYPLTCTFPDGLHHRCVSEFYERDFQGETPDVTAADDDYECECFDDATPEPGPSHTSSSIRLGLRTRAEARSSTPVTRPSYTPSRVSSFSNLFTIFVIISCRLSPC